MAHVAQQSDYMPLNVIPRPTLSRSQERATSACRGICEAGRDYSPVSTGKAGATTALPGMSGAKTLAWLHGPCRAEASTVQVAVPCDEPDCYFRYLRLELARGMAWGAVGGSDRVGLPVGRPTPVLLARAAARERVASQWTSTMITTHLANSEQLPVHTDNEISSHNPTKLGY
ncbi:hypothetical protein Purlil1_12104 [Purpureocillium lilacinum]|uniref:Uncharacterized protein n=1 Tax=Purpureocillium lilacinum TaxID=33203 RepID=A0ABR0BHR1_PURLI|nr:hypothetical protein Purlil1_12104 [Purpureocillium lilacinum]